MSKFDQNWLSSFWTSTGSTKKQYIAYIQFFLNFFGVQGPQNSCILVDNSTTIFIVVHSLLLTIVYCENVKNGMAIKSKVFHQQFGSRVVERRVRFVFLRCIEFPAFLHNICSDSSIAWCSSGLSTSCQQQLFLSVSKELTTDKATPLATTDTAASVRSLNLFTLF